ncbi:laccase 1 [Russula earlei]|uniref:Laccase 1 n=1 Tax=Russula earlei TaxID=71964 RepID=A0ACC0UHS6_9AGAM|nr:laccase 1 [Russula earlei]
MSWAWMSPGYQSRPYQRNAFAAIGPVASLRIVNKPISPDGFPRSAVLADGTFPGPLIRANKNDDFSLNVLNELTNSTMDLVTSVHWHGIFQKTTNYADGGAMVNQCPIVPKKSFLYQFNAGEQTGTYWYHSHFKAQYCDGLRGPLVIYDPNDPHRALYNIDNEYTVITLGDWYHAVSSAMSQFSSTLINGKGRYPGGPQNVPLAVVNVQSGLRYRLRLVSISCDPAYKFSIDKHQLTVIEVDGNNVKEVVVDSLDIFAGQRYSVVLYANQASAAYWIRALPNAEGQNFAGFTNVAILRYVDARVPDPPTDPNVDIPRSLLPLNETDLHPLFPTPVPGPPCRGCADYNFNLNVTVDQKPPPPGQKAPFFVNGTSYQSPSVPVLLQILNGIDPYKLLPNGSIYPINRSMSVELSIPAGVAAGPHPVHLHGHSFHVVRSANSSKYNYEDPVIRDVVSMGNSTFGGDNVTIRFYTDNPGPWFFHCHIEEHLVRGFAVVFAEDTKHVKSEVVPPPQWSTLCPAYSSYVTSSASVKPTRVPDVPTPVLSSEYYPTLSHLSVSPSQIPLLPTPWP